MSDTKRKGFIVIGVAVMLLGFVLPPMGTITETGMRMLGIFLGTLFLWSTVGGPWTSLLAIFMIGLSGYTETFLGALTGTIGDDNFILVMFSFILFGGGLAASNSMQYVTRWILTRKFIAGKPYTMLAAIGFCSYLLAFVVNQMVSSIIMLAVVAAICSSVEIEHGKDKIWIYMFGMIFLGAGIGQPGFVYKGIGMTMINVFTKIADGAYTISPIGYMLFNFMMSMMMIAVFLLLIKFVFRPDMSKLSAITVESIEKSSELPPISKTQKAYLWMLILFLVMVILPNFKIFLTIPGFKLLKQLGVHGVLTFWIILFSVVKLDGKPLLNIQQAASQGIVWNVTLMVTTGVMLGNAIGNADLGIITVIKQALNPILAGKPTIVVVFIIFLAALLITNFAVNLAMAVALMPIIVACSTQLGLNPAPIAMGVMMICFFAMMTPAASPLAAYCFGEEKYFNAKEIQSYAIPLSFAAVILYTFVGYPLASILVNL